MIKTLSDLSSSIIDTIKVNTTVIDNTKTQGVKLRPLLQSIVDTLNDLTEKLGLSFDNKLNNLTNSLPDFKLFSLKSDSIPFSKITQVPTLVTSYTQLTDRPTIPTYDLSPYQKTSDAIAYSRLTNVPTGFSGSYSDLSNKPTLFDGAWSSLTGRPTLITTYNQLAGLPVLFDGNYNSLNNKPNIPTYDLTLYRLKSDSIDYTTLANKPSVSKLLWNQLSPFILTNSVAETNALVQANGNGNLLLDANPPVGTSFRITGRGLFNTQTLAPTPTLTIKLYLGSTVIATGSVASFLLGATNRPLTFYIDVLIDSTSTVYTQGSMSYFATVADTLSAAPITSNGASISVNLSIANQLKMTLTWSVANTANTIQMKIINLEKLNN